MKIKIKIIIIITILVSINVYCCILLSTNKNDIREIVFKYQLQIDQLTDMSKNILLLSKIQYMTEGENVKNVMLYSIEGDSILLMEELDSVPKLIYYFSGNGCHGCFEPILLKLDSLGKEIGYEKILILAKFSNNRNLKSYWSDKPQQIPIYRIEDNLELFYSSEYDYAYAFLLNNTLNARKFIVTDKSNIIFSDQYFQIITEYFQKKIIVN